MTPEPLLYWPRLILCHVLVWVSEVAIALAEAVAPEEVKQVRRASGSLALRTK